MGTGLHKCDAPSALASGRIELSTRSEFREASLPLVRQAPRDPEVHCDLRVIPDGEAVVTFIDGLDLDGKLRCPNLSCWTCTSRSVTALAGCRRIANISCDDLHRPKWSSSCTLFSVA